MKLICVLSACLAMAGCMTANKHAQQLASTSDRALTLGIVQKQIKPGLAQGDVATVLGSPNIVTSDNQSHETWIYDKVASEASFSQDNGSVFSTVSPSYVNRASVSANLGGNYSKSAGAASITQRTLTVVIKFTPDNKVESVSYNSTRF